jgi:hypothetical protein
MPSEGNRVQLKMTIDSIRRKSADLSLVLQSLDQNSVEIIGLDLKGEALGDALVIEAFKGSADDQFRELLHVRNQIREAITTLDNLADELESIAAESQSIRADADFISWQLTTQCSEDDDERRSELRKLQNRIDDFEDKARDAQRDAARTLDQISSQSHHGAPYKAPSFLSTLGHSVAGVAGGFYRAGEETVAAVPGFASGVWERSVGGIFDHDRFLDAWSDTIEIGSYVITNPDDVVKTTWAEAKADPNKAGANLIMMIIPFGALARAGKLGKTAQQSFAALDRTSDALKAIVPGTKYLETSKLAHLATERIPVIRSITEISELTADGASSSSASLWGLPVLGREGRGIMAETAVLQLRKLDEGGWHPRFPPGYRTIDQFNAQTGEVLSVKSMNLSLERYALKNDRNAEMARNLENYLTKLGDFTGADEYGGVASIENYQVQVKTLELVVPKGRLTSAHVDQFDAVVQNYQRRTGKKVQVVLTEM